MVTLNHNEIEISFSRTLARKKELLSINHSLKDIVNKKPVVLFAEEND